MKYLLVHEEGYTDTTERILFSHLHTNAFFLPSYRKLGAEQSVHHYKFPAMQKFEVRTNYLMVDSSVVDFEGKDYHLYKYLFADADAIEEETVYCYSPDFGILVFQSLVSGNYEKLVDTGSPADDRVIAYLAEALVPGGRHRQGDQEAVSSTSEAGRGDN